MLNVANRADVAARLFLGAIGVATISSQAFAQGLNLKSPTFKDNGSQVCSGGRLDNARLASWYFYNDADVANNFASPDDLQRSFRAPMAEQGRKGEVVKNIVAELQAMITAPKSGFQPNVSFNNVNAANFLAGLAPTLVINCTTPSGASVVLPGPGQPAAGPPAGGTAPSTASGSSSESAGQQWGVTNFRVRGTSDALLPPRGSDAFTSATPATLSVSENGPTKTTSNALQTTIGYDFHFPQATTDQHWPPVSNSLLDIIPFIGVDRNITNVAGKQSSSSRDNIMTGMVGRCKRRLSDLPIVMEQH
jgi:hypothetical protein